MPTIDDLHKLALSLPESQRAVLAADLLDSLPPVLHDADEGIAEANRRDAELDAGSEMEIGLEDLDRQVRGRRG